MPNRTISEELFEQLCSSSKVPCQPVVTGVERTPDFRIWLGGIQVICEVKQINPNAEDRAELEDANCGEAVGRLVPNRMRKTLKDVSAQLKVASRGGFPTLLVVYDNTPFKMYTFHSDVVQAIFGHDCVSVSFFDNSADPPMVSEPFFGGDRAFTPNHNTSVSALAILDGGPTSRLSLRVYHNPYALVLLQTEILDVLPVTRCLLPDATRIAL